MSDFIPPGVLGIAKNLRAAACDVRQAERSAQRWDAGEKTPEVRGELVATIPWNRYSELRMSWEEGNSAYPPMLHIGIWRALSEDRFVPTKAAIAVSVYRLAAFADGIATALEFARSHYVEAARRRDMAANGFGNRR